MATSSRRLLLQRAQPLLSASNAARVGVHLPRNARLFNVTPTAAVADSERPDRIRVRKESSYMDKVPGKEPWVQYLKICLTPQSADYELTPEQLVNFANTLMSDDEDPPDLFYQGGWDDEKQRPNGKGVVSFKDGTCVEHENWGEIWDEKYEAWLQLMRESR